MIDFGGEKKGGKKIGQSDRKRGSWVMERKERRLLGFFGVFT